MRDLRQLEQYRVRSKDIIAIYGSHGDDTCGCFTVLSPLDGNSILIIASSGGDWDHVSASRKARCPTWEEMEYVKRLFFKDDETVIQLHVPESEYINVHPYTLHMWRPQIESIPIPPVYMV